MSFYEFKKNDLLRNTIIAHPKISFKIANKRLYYNNIKLSISVPDGFIHINDLNIGCDPGQLDFSCPDSSALIGVI